MTHTPGPWEVQYNTVIECWDVGKAGEERLEGLLASVLSSNADARLIAAAPDMLDALESVANCARAVVYESRYVYVIDRASFTAVLAALCRLDGKSAEDVAAAIAKAEGGE